MNRLVAYLSILTIGFAVGWSVAFTIAERHLEALQRQHERTIESMQKVYRFPQMGSTIKMPANCSLTCGGVQ